MRNCVFIHTNHKQLVGAKVAEYAMRRNSRCRSWDLSRWSLDCFKASLV